MLMHHGCSICYYINIHDIITFKIPNIRLRKMVMSNEGKIATMSCHQDMMTDMSDKSKCLIFVIYGVYIYIYMLRQICLLSVFGE